MFKELKDINSTIEKSKALQKKGDSEIREAKRALKYTSEEAADREISRLDAIMASGVPISEERNILNQIRQVRSAKNEIASFLVLEEKIISNAPGSCKAMYEQRDAIKDQIGKLKEMETTLDAEIGEVRAVQKSMDSEISELEAAKKAAYSSRKESKAALTELNQWYDEQVAAHRAWTAYQKEARAAAELERKEFAKAEKERLRLEREAAEALLDPYEDDKARCDGLLGYLYRFVPKKDSTSSSVVNNCNDNNLNQEDSWMLGPSKPARKRKEKKAKTLKISHSPDVFADFAKLGVALPTDMDAVVAAIESVAAKRLYFETAPHPKVIAAQAKAEKAARAEEQKKLAETKRLECLQKELDDEIARARDEAESLENALKAEADAIAIETERVAKAEAERIAKEADDALKMERLVAEMEAVERDHERAESLNITRTVTEMERTRRISEISEVEIAERDSRVRLSIELANAEQLRRVSEAKNSELQCNLVREIGIQGALQVLDEEQAERASSKAPTNPLWDRVAKQVNETK